MPTRVKPPDMATAEGLEYLEFLCPLSVEATGGDGKQTPSFSMVAYTGGVMRISGFPHPVVVDLEGLAIERQDLPVRLDHNPRQGVGHTRRVAVEDGQVVAEGLVSRDTSWARDVARSGANGFPWRASIGAAVVEAEFVPSGHRVTVNGRTFDGPLHVVRQAVLKEISFVDSGADTGARARVAAREKETEAMDDVVTTPAEDQAATETAPETPQPERRPEPQPEPAPKPDTDTPPDPAPTPETVEAAAAEDGDPVIAMRRRMAAETRRVEAIHRLTDGKHPDIEARAIEEGWDETRAELEVLRASRP